MKEYRLNPKAKKIDLTIHVDIQSLETEGWDFSEYHENTARALGISEEEAEQRNYSEYSAQIILRTSEKGDVETFVQWYSHDRNEETTLEETGDDEQTVKDIISLLAAGLIHINDDDDYSTDDNGNYVPAIISAYKLPKIL